MINFNGELLENNALFLNEENRGLRYGDSLFESIRVVNGKIYFWEDHYLRLMASMRILRMEIPMNFTMEYLEEKILETIEASQLQNSAVRIRITVYRDNGGLYLPTTNNISYIIEAKALENPFYVHKDGAYEVELFKDHYVNTGLLSTLKSNNRIINVLGSIYANENGYDNCLLLNNAKQVVEALNGNLFLVKGSVIKTPPLKDGCLNGITRKKLIASLEKLENYTLEEASISPFELQKADELFVTNAITGIQSITKYRKKEFSNEVAKDLLGKLNALARLS
ncbi:aminotransferase class IV [Cellulophaga fucicola]|uniref:branched-chain-amino-acid transaminase n=1 Tax=Cellulophaga fucicola TaxID=76595 RepID=A0A1K1MRQ2_9FLAO|nr:aminotransferase class IV [Cellulophaga fucicola]SFW25791.1 branched-chain amino acid aminotransferase [Cellulophaga fucicola]